MSMSICLAKVSPVLAQRIETDPELLNQVWLEADGDEPPVGANSDIAAIDRDRDLFVGAHEIPGGWAQVIPQGVVLWCCST